MPPLTPRRRFPPWRTCRHLLAVLLLVQVVLAPGMCLAVRGGAAAAMPVEVCTADGMRLLRLGDAGEGTPRPAPPGGGGHVDACLFCHGAPQAPVLPGPPAVPPPQWVATLADWVPHGGAAAPTPPVSGPPSGARAPPVMRI